ncbi:MAG: sulfur oxidation c-type cytochrome SoxX [Caldimonas sp.]
MRNECNRSIGAIALLAAAIAAGCATPASTSKTDYDAMATAMIKSSFHAQGQATLDRIEQDPLQHACSSATPPPADVVARLEKHELDSIKPPPDGRYLGDWREGEKLAQNGRGMTWTDKAGAANGGNCYNCHELSKTEIAYGTLGPSLHNYGKLRGVVDPTSAAAAPVVQYTWGKLYNAKASNACSIMPRFGEAHVLTAKQMQDLMALLLDPKSSVNQ